MQLPYAIRIIFTMFKATICGCLAALFCRRYEGDRHNPLEMICLSDILDV